MKDHFLKTLVHAVVAGAVGVGLCASAQSPSTPKVADVAKALGFTQAEIERIQGGEIITKDLKEGSEKELAGVLAAFFKKPVKELADTALEGKLLATDPTIRAHQVWAPDTPAEEVFANLVLDMNEKDESALYTRAAPGSKLNLSSEEIARFKATTPEKVNAELRAMLKARYEAYRQSGLKGIAPYARGGKNTASPADELTLAIKETMAAARQNTYFEALLNYPANPMANVEHRFYWFKQEVEKRPTFILAHRASLRGEDAALLTEEQYYVSHSYNSNFIAGGCLSVEDGTLVFYVNRSFTDQVAGMGGGLKHSIGRKQMLSEVAANLKRLQGQVKQ